MNYLLCCHQCGEVVVKDTGSEAKIRSRILVVKSTTAFAVCKGCGTDVELPLKLDTELLKSMQSKPKLFITKTAK